MTLLHLHGGILLFLEQQKPLEDAIQVYLEKLVTVVDSLLELRRDLKGFFEIRYVRVNEYGVGVAVDNLG